MVSTHDVDFAYRWANRIIIIHDGKIVADGEPEQIFGDIDILQKSNLKQPMLMKVSEILKERGILPEEAFPNSIDMFEKLFKK